jgi:beta-lactamase superfamily II metal-dependent hydrolase
VTTRVPGAAITVESLPVGYGDCLLISCPVPDGTWHALIDTGPDETWPTVRDRLAALPAAADGTRQIDLAIVSHIDHDHIGAAGLMFAAVDLGLVFKDVWFNGRHHLARGVAEGESLAAILGAPEQQLGWNTAFAGGPVVTPGDAEFVELRSRPGYPQITLLSPTPKRLARLATVWDRELAKLRAKQSNTVPELERGAEFPDLEALAAHKSTKDRSAANGSSIAILLEHQGASALLAADSYSTVLGSALLALARKRGSALPLEVDAFKLSHHGSRANLVPELLGVVRAGHYIVSTDNSRFEHPNDETLARVVLYGGQKPNLCFNFPTTRNLRWSDDALQRKYNFTTSYAQPGCPLVLRLPARH